MPRLSPEQKAARRHVIGSSDVAELLGLSPYEGASPMRLFAEKAGLLGVDDDDEDSVETEVGHELEEGLCRLYERYSGYRIMRAGPFVETVRHPRLPFLAANLDGRIVDKPAALEVKIVGIGMHHDWDLDTDDGIPNYVRVQTAHQMSCAELDQIHVTALVGGPNGFRVFYVDRDRELEDLILGECSSFWQRLMDREPPPLDASSATREYLNAKYPAQAEVVELEITPSACAAAGLDYERTIALGTQRLEASDLEKRAKEAKEIRNAQIIEAMGKLGAGKVWCSTWKASYKPDKNGQRSLLVKPNGAAKQPKVRARKANAERLPPLEHGEDLF